MKKAFTLIEMMFCLVIVIVLMGLIIPNVLSKQSLVKDKGCDALLEIVNAQVVLYEINEGELPGSIDDLINATPSYLKENQRVCPSGKEIYIDDGQAYVD